MTSKEIAMALTERGKQVANNPIQVVPKRPDLSYHVALSRVVIATWYEACEEGKAGIERALFNVGVEQISGRWVLQISKFQEDLGPI
jgi:hypothetical protein